MSTFWGVPPAVLDEMKRCVRLVYGMRPDAAIVMETKFIGGCPGCPVLADNLASLLGINLFAFQVDAWETFGDVLVSVRAALEVQAESERR